MSILPTRKPFYKTLIELMIPIAIMQLFNSGLALVDNMLVGQLGEVPVTAVSLAYQIYFILSLIYFAVNSGSAIFTAQFWGGQDIDSIRRVVVLNLIFNVAFGLLFTCLAQFIPAGLMSIFTDDQQVISVAVAYLRVYSIGYIFTGVSQGLYGILRSTERVRLPMLVNSLALVLNTGLGYLLIFGKLGFPSMGVLGAAYANVTARVIELVVVLVYLLSTRSILITDLRTMLPIPLDFIRQFLRTSFPVIVNEIFWSVGVSAYNAIYAHIGTTSMAAMNIATNIESFAFVPFLALQGASAVMIGNRIGAGEEGIARAYSRIVLKLAIILGGVVGLAMYFGKDGLLQIYKITSETRQIAIWVITVLAIILIIKAWNITMIIGVVRAGGDTRFTMIVELCTMWLYGVPAAWIGANLLHLPVYWVAAIVASEEVIKAVIMFFRYRSRKWIHNLMLVEGGL